MRKPGVLLEILTLQNTCLNATQTFYPGDKYFNHWKGLAIQTGNFFSTHPSTLRMSLSLQYGSILVAEGGEGFTDTEGSCECKQNAIMYPTKRSSRVWGLVGR